MLQAARTLESLEMDLLPSLPIELVPDYSVCPEQKLWAAVVWQSILEYEECLLMIRRQHDNHDGAPVNYYFYNMLASLRYEMNHRWFRDICAISNMEHEKVLAKLKQFDEEYRLNEVSFTTGTPDIRSPVLDETRRQKYLYGN